MTKLNPSNIEIGIINSPGDLRLNAVHDCYTRSFTLKEEQIPLEAFQEALLANTNPDVQKMGAAKEVWLYVKDKKTGKVFAGFNFNVFAGNAAEGVDGTGAATFAFVDADRRREGTYKILVEAAEKFARDFVTKNTGVQDPNILVFCEQNNPLMMTANEYAADSDYGLDQNRRRTLFEKIFGFKQLGFRYIQPCTGSVDDGETHVTYLDLIVRGMPKGATSVPTAAVVEHLNRWFAASFPEGTSMDNKCIAPMARSLARFADKNIPLLPNGRFHRMDEVLGRKQVDAILEKGGIQGNQRLGEVFPDIAIQTLGTDFVDHAKDVLWNAAKHAKAAIKTFNTATGKKFTRHAAPGPTLAM